MHTVNRTLGSLIDTHTHTHTQRERERERERESGSNILSRLASCDDSDRVDEAVFIVRLHVVDAVIFIVLRTFHAAFRNDEIVVLR